MGIDMANAELIDHTALALHDLLEKGEITPLDCLDALEARIARDSQAA